jgi:hypothetical protein
MQVPRGEDPSLDHPMQLMEHQLSAMIVGRLVIESLLVKFVEMQPGRRHRQGNETHRSPSRASPVV